MAQGDVSFTFMDRVKEVELNIEDGRWQSALALALTLPDICGGIAFPEIVKKYRDGRIMMDRQKNPTRDVGGQYIRWFDEYASDYFKIKPEDESPYICGERCWQLRCEYLHQNRGFLNPEDETGIRFHLGVNCGASVCQTKGNTREEDGITDIRIDIEQFCWRMCSAAKNYYKDMEKVKNFSLYNTPVLDFIQKKQGTRTNPLIAVLCKESGYGRGLQMALKEISEQVMLFSSWEKGKKGLGKKKPVIWIVTEDILSEQENSEQTYRNRPVILLARHISKEDSFLKNMGKTEILSFPVSPETLRKTVLDILA